MIKRRHLSSIQKDKNVCRNRRYARAITLAEKFERNTRIIEITLWQDERNFPLYGPVNLKMTGYKEKEKETDVPDENLFASTNRM